MKCVQANMNITKLQFKHIPGDKTWEALLKINKLRKSVSEPWVESRDLAKHRTMPINGLIKSDKTFSVRR